MTELWERFSYYAMRGILIFYMIYLLKMENTHASNIYGIFTSLEYLSTLLGGFLADRYLGQKWATIWGGLMIAAGGQVYGHQIGAGAVCVFVNRHLVPVQRRGQQIGGRVLGVFPKNQQRAVLPVAGDCAAGGVGRFDAVYEKNQSLDARRTLKWNWLYKKRPGNIRGVFYINNWGNGNKPRALNHRCTFLPGYW